jgi:hypothetical protein
MTVNTIGRALTRARWDRCPLTGMDWPDCERFGLVLGGADAPVISLPIPVQFLQSQNQARIIVR